MLICIMFDIVYMNVIENKITKYLLEYTGLNLYTAAFEKNFQIAIFVIIIYIPQWDSVDRHAPDFCDIAKFIAGNV